MRRRFLSALPIVAVLLWSCARRPPAAPEALPASAAPVSCASCTGTLPEKARAEETCAGKAPAALSGKERTRLLRLLRRLLTCETGTLGSTRRLAALTLPLWEWAAEHPCPEEWDSALRSFACSLSEEERQELREKLALMLVLCELPETELSMLLEEAGSSHFSLPERTGFFACLERLQTFLA